MEKPPPSLNRAQPASYEGRNTYLGMKGNVMRSLKSFAASALVIAATCGVATAQVAPTQVLPEGRLYVFHSKAAGSCPALDWHIVVGSDNTLSGMIAWNDMKDMARAKGTISVNKTFRMTATEVGGAARTAEITGEINQLGWFIANIKGNNIDCKRVSIPFYPGNFGGGGG